MVQKTALVILDGWGIGRHDASDAIWNANTHFTDSLSSKYPKTTLRTDGLNVGLPEGQMGNSEVGHMNIGAGRVVWQMLVRINESLKNGIPGDTQIWEKLISDALNNSSRLHLIGLLSDGGVHSHIQHLISLCKLAKGRGVQNIYIHAFLDGRDTDPKSGMGYLNTIHEQLNGIADIATVVGRYFAMDRDKRWERVAKAYNVMVHADGEKADNPVQFVSSQYNSGVTDEFMNPATFLPGNSGQIAENDTVLCFNYRTDRGRQITSALTQQDFPEAGMRKLKLNYYTLTEYDETFQISGVLFKNQNLTNTLGEVISANNCTQLRAAETEKYPHVTFFFSGGREEPFDGEQRLLVNSPKVATYDLQPEMSAPELADKAIQIIADSKPDFICLNFANPDMVGHTGVFNAIVKAVETVDAQLEKVVDAAVSNGYVLIVIADHGNADFAINDDGTPNTAHSTNPVPCWLIGAGNSVNLHPGKLADVAPTILKLMGISQPAEMTGNPLF